uniref:Uncharacterized protein n=1 Tax=Ursus americanus TaxID=9643 RepID=A0A452SMQ3_URSAM
MASESVNAKQARNHCTKGKRQQHQQIKNRSSISDGDGEDSFIFEANEAWKDFHGSLLRFYENGELCDVTLKVRLSFFLFQSLYCIMKTGFLESHKANFWCHTYLLQSR